MLRTVCTIAGAFSMAIGLTATPTYAQPIEPEADKILHAMANYVAGLKTFTADYDVDDEVVDVRRPERVCSASGSIATRAPGQTARLAQGLVRRRRADLRRQDDLDPTAKNRTLRPAGKPRPTIDEAIEEVRSATGFDASGGDLIAADPYAVLTEVWDVGRPCRLTGLIGGFECDHLAFRNPRVDWQIWVQKGDEPLPLKYVITTKSG